MKRMLLLLALLLLSFPLTSKGKGSSPKGKASEGQKTVLTIWAFNTDLKPVITDFEAEHPDVKVELVVTPTVDFITKIRPVLATGKGSSVPDLFATEVSYLKYFIDSPYYLDLAPYQVEQHRDKYVREVWEMGRDKNGNMKALSWQATPGSFYFRRSYAKKYFGSDDLDFIAQKIKGWDGFLATARELKEKSGGQIKMLAGLDDLIPPVLFGRQAPQVTNGKYSPVPEVDLLLKLMRTFEEEGLTARTTQWQQSWYTAMKKDSPVFGFILPPWGHEYVLKPQAVDSIGDWAVTFAPTHFYWGGTWLGIYSKSPRADLAFEFIRMVTLNEEYMYKWGKQIGDAMSSYSVNTRLSDSSSELLGGQKPYQIWLKIMEQPSIYPKIVTEYDSRLEKIFREWGLSYATDPKMTLEQAKAEIAKRVYSDLPELKP